jgi:hypothetical protein
MEHISFSEITANNEIIEALNKIQFMFFSPN